MQSLLIGGAIFALAVASPLIIDLIPSGKDDDESLNQKIVTVKLPPKNKKNLKIFHHHHHHLQKWIR
jgi:protein TonB